MNIQTDHRVGARIRAARKAAGRDRRWLADRLQLREPAYSRDFFYARVEQLEANHPYLQIHAVELAAIAKALNCSLLYLLGVEDG